MLPMLSNCLLADLALIRIDFYSRRHFWDLLIRVAICLLNICDSFMLLPLALYSAMFWVCWLRCKYLRLNAILSIVIVSRMHEVVRNIFSGVKFMEKLHMLSAKIPIFSLLWNDLNALNVMMSPRLRLMRFSHFNEFIWLLQ